VRAAADLNADGLADIVAWHPVYLSGKQVAAPDIATCVPPRPPFPTDCKTPSF
jgi:hypothetical protein